MVKEAAARAEGLIRKADETLDTLARDDLVKPLERELRDARRHIANLLELVAGLNANHEPIKGWCKMCDGNFLHTTETCACVCHPARRYLDSLKE